MQNNNKSTYPENFRKAVRYWMADNDIGSIRQAAPHLNLTYMALYKILDGTNNPTVEHGITLCLKAGIDANWLFLNTGSMRFEESATLSRLSQEVTEIKQLLTGISELTRQVNS